MASYLDPISREAFYSVWTNVEYVNYIPNKWVLAPQNNMSIFIEKEEEEQAYQKIQKIYSGSYGFTNTKSYSNKKDKAWGDPEFRDSSAEESNQPTC